MLKIICGDPISKKCGGIKSVYAWWNLRLSGKYPPLAFEHQGNMDDWLILEKIEDVIVGTSIPYNYENSKF